MEYKRINSSKSSRRFTANGEVTEEQNIRTVQINGQCHEIEIGGNKNHQTIKSGTPKVSITGNDNSIQTEGSTGRIQISGNKNKATVGENSGHLTLSGNDHEIIIQGNSGHIVVNGNDILVDIAGDVNSITITGNDNEIRVGGSCLGEIRLGAIQGGPKPCDTCRNSIKIGGTAPNLSIGYTTNRNEIQCQWIETIEMNGIENRVKANYKKLVTHGELNACTGVVEDRPPVVRDLESDDENENRDDDEEIAEDSDNDDEEIAEDSDEEIPEDSDEEEIAEDSDNDDDYDFDDDDDDVNEEVAKDDNEDKKDSQKNSIYNID